MITKKPAKNFSGEILGRIGSYDFYSSGFVVNGGNDKIQALIGYTYSESGQYEDGESRNLWQIREGLGAAYNTKGQNADAFSKHDFWGAIQIIPNNKQSLLLEHIYGRAENILTPRVAFDTEKEVNHLSRISWSINNLNDFSNNLKITFYRNEVNHFPSQKMRITAAPKNNIVESVYTGGSIHNKYALNQTTYTYGLDFYRRNWFGDVYDSITGDIVNPYLIPTVRDLNIGAFVQIDRIFDDWTLATGLRYDNFSQEAKEELIHSSSVTSSNRKKENLIGGHISLRRFFLNKISVFGGLGRSYRTPTGTERYIQGNPTFFGNPDLKPTANSEVDLGISYFHDRLRTQIKIFYSKLQNYIYQENNNAGYSSYNNIDAYIYGGDLKIGLELGIGFSIDAGMAMQRGFKDSFPDNNNDKDLGQIAPLKSQLVLKYLNNLPFGRMASLNATIEWVHSQSAKNVDEEAGEKKLPAWNILNTRLGYNEGAWLLNLGINNIFNQTYSLVNSYEWDVIGGTDSNPGIVKEPGRFFYSSIGWKW